MAAIAGINGDVWLSTSPPTALGSPESMTDSGDHIHYFTATHQGWDQSQSFVIQNSPNGSSGWVTVTDYVFYYACGMIIFNSARVPGTNNFTRISTGSYFALTALDGAHSWTMSITGAVKDVTPFQSSGSWIVNAATTKSLTATVNCFRYDGRVLAEMITSGVGLINVSGGIILCQLWTNEAAGARFQFFARPTAITETVAEMDIDQQNVTFAASGPLVYITSNTFTTVTVIQA